LIHFLFGVDVDGAIFGAMVDFVVLVCMGLGLAPDHGSKLRLVGYFGEIFGQKFGNLPTAEVLQIFYSSSLMVCCPRNLCYVLASGNCVGCHYNKLLGLHLVLPLSAAAQACGSAESQIC
jgi:hypothetical protein